MAAPLVILGASSRAAAQSALRAAFTPICADLFADADLARCCTVRRCEHWPTDLELLAASFPPAPWIYTGGLENHGRLIERIAAGRVLLGNRGSALRATRNPLAWTKLLTSAGVLCPPCVASAEGLPLDGSWLSKGRRSSGGFQVRRWQGPAPGSSSAVGRYFQKFILGVPTSAAYVAAGGQARFIGLTEQLLTGDDPLAPFRYAGSLGPLPFSAALGESLARLGNVLAEGIGMVGLFGVDGILAEGTFWPVEINPRYTASMELYDRAFDVSLIAWHVAACRDGRWPETPPRIDSAWHAKRVVYAAREVRISDAFERLLGGQPEFPTIADVPHAGTIIPAGHPVLTVFTAGSDRETACHNLRQRECEITALLG